ncbi:MAG TPA: protein kinase [Gemmatimonadaceae bacterium]|nr:protein kinase [Gemmatimonadaceae bacterium]
MSTSTDRLRDALSGQYDIQREIGSGGMALVYLAEDLKHRRQVAIKVLKPELAATIGGERFLREIEIAARLSHPHILPLFDSGAAGDLLYYVMPFVPGESLRSRLVRERQLPVDDALRLTREVASAIGFAHQHGIVHRDIKPENILLADGIALVADFGIARAVRSSRENGDGGHTALTAIGLALGTPTYMSPEQFTADDVDARSDIYSLGCVLFEMLAGQPPFTGSLDALLRMHLTTDPRPLSDLRPTVSLSIARIAARALAKDPADRFATAASFAEAIATAVSGGVLTPVTADTRSDTPNNLPRQRTRFIGRERELAECARVLGETRLLTLTGIGGSGKTRLALRLAEVMLPTFPDGIWFIDFAPLVDADRVMVTAAAALGVKESADAPARDALLGALAGKRTLLVLDNCEHLLGPVSELVDALLTADDGIRIVATSREGLGLEGERVLAVRSMTLTADARDLRALAESDAVKLFVDRAQASRRDFTLAPDNAASVAEICRRLDGIPLAIELAAARVKALSVEQIRSRLDDRFRLLTGGRSAVPRQQTLLATIQWSYDQLSAEEQSLLRALSVFSGGWTLESATAIADSTDEFEVLDLLTRLIDKSLVQVEQVAGEARYGMLETVRQYALEKLVESGEADAVRERHLNEFAALTERFYAERLFKEEPWNERLTREMDNLRSALSFVRDRDAERYLTMVGALAYFWWARSHIIEGRTHLNAALSVASPDPVRRSYARAVRGQGMLSAYEGGHTVARELMEQTLAMWRQLGDQMEIAASLETLGWSQFLASEDEAACATFEELLGIMRNQGDPNLINRGKVALGQMFVALSRVDEARGLASEILEFSRRAGDRRAEHSGFHFLADCALIEGNAAESLGLYGESLLLAAAIGDRMETAFEIEGIGMSLAALGRHADGIRLIAASRAECARLGINLKIRFWDALLERFVAPARAALGPVGTEAAERAGREMTFEATVTEASALASAE